MKDKFKDFENLISPFETLVKHYLRFYNESSYSPYSKFKVSSCLVVNNNGKISYIGGTNVENSSYGLSICAERNAIFGAVSERLIPSKDVSWLFIALYVPTTKFITPCGACRQVISEFVNDILIVSYNIEFERKFFTLDDIFKERFGPQDLS